MMRWSLAGIRLLMGMFFILGCKGDVGGAPLVPDPAQLYAELRLNHEAVILTKNAPYDTVQLRVIPISANGDTLAYDSTITFFRARALDTSVRVDSLSGMVTSRGTSDFTEVIARLTIGAVTRTDTVRIMIRNDNPIRPLTRIEISPLPPDSGVRWAAETQQIFYESWVRYFDDADNPLQGLSHISIQKPEVFFGGSVAPQYPYATALIGETYVYANVYAYGQHLRDSTLFRRVDPPIRLVIIDRLVPAKGIPKLVLLPARIEAKVGTTIAFLNRFGFYTNAVVDDAFGVCPNASFCGNRVRRSVLFDGLDSMVWVDSVDINFDQPSFAGAGDTYGFFSFRNVSMEIPYDGTTGNIPAFSTLYCKDGDFDGMACGQFLSDFFNTFEILDNGMRTRKFTVPGTYHYSSTRFPELQGVIVITE